MLKSVHSPSVYGKNYFFVSWKCTNFQKVIFAKVTVGRILTIEGEKVGKESRWTKQKVTMLRENDPKKWPFDVRKMLKISTLNVIIERSHSVTRHFAINWKQKK